MPQAFAASTAALYDRTDKCVDKALDALRDFRARLPRKLGISYDEWNVWYAWYREIGILEGLYAAKMLTCLMRNWEACDLRYVCYFQPVNEQAIDVGPFGSRLTSIGEAMRLAKGHVGCVPAEIPHLPSEAFVTDAEDGTRYMTFYNFSIAEPLVFRIPAGGRTKVAIAETLAPDGLEPGCRYERRPGTGKVANDVFELTLAPASLACARLAF